MKKSLIALTCITILLFMSCDNKEEKKPEVKKVEQVKDSVPKQIEKKVVKKQKKDPVIVFTVQIGAFKKYGQSLSQLPKVITYSKDDFSKYSLGSFKTVKEAVNFMYSIEEDYPDCFIQALKDGKPIPITEALKKK